MDLLDEIKKIKKEDIQDVVQAVLAQYKAFYPEWDISLLSLEKKGDRNEQIDRVIALMEKLKD